MPRPLVKSCELRARVDCYFNSSERVLLNARATQAGLALSTYIRESALGKSIKVLPTINAERWAELARTTSNLNQLLHHLNEGRIHEVNSALLVALLEQVQSLRQELIGGRDDSKVE